MLQLSWIPEGWAAAFLITLIILILWSCVMVRWKKKPHPELKVGEKLQILEILPLDAQRKLIMVGRGQDTLVVLLSPKAETMILLPSLPAHKDSREGTYPSLAPEPYLS